MRRCVVENTATLKVHQVVGEAHDYERYVVVAGFRDATLEIQTLLDDCLGHVAERVCLMTQFVDPPYDLILRIAAMDAVTRQDEQVFSGSEWNGAALRLRDHELLHLNVTKRATNA